MVATENTDEVPTDSADYFSFEIEGKDGSYKVLNDGSIEHSQLWAWIGVIYTNDLLYIHLQSKTLERGVFEVYLKMCRDAALAISSGKDSWWDNTSKILKAYTNIKRDSDGLLELWIRYSELEQYRLPDIDARDRDTIIAATRQALENALQRIS
jgi:hypothetical protein